MDLVIFAGPVIVKSAFRQIPWERETRIVEVTGSGSTYFSNLAGELQGADGRILPGLLRRYARLERAEVDRLALCAWSAGWGLLNRIFRVDADRAVVDACVASDASFGTGLTGYSRFAADAIRGERLMVSTTTNNSANPQLGIMKTGRDTWLEIQGEARDLVRSEMGRSYEPRQIAAKDPMPPASGGVWRTGAQLYWYDYVQPGSPAGHGNDLSHAQHHDLAVEAWTAYLVPEFGGWQIPWQAWVGIGLGLAGLGIGWATLRSR